MYLKLLIFSVCIIHNVYATESIDLFFNSDTDILLEISDINTEVEIIVSSNGSSHYVIPSHDELILPKLIYIPKSQNNQFVTIKPLYRSNKKLSFKHELISLEDHNNLAPLLNELNDFYRKTATTESYVNQHDYRCLAQTVEGDIAAKINNNLFSLKILELWAKEDYTALINIIRNSCLGDESVASPEEIGLVSIYARSLLNLNKFNQAIGVFNAVTKASKSVSKSEAMFISLAELEGDAGLTKMLIANQKKSRGLLEEGKSHIINALNILPHNIYSMSKAKLYANLWSYYGLNNQFQDGLAVVLMGLEQLDGMAIPENHPMRLVLLSHLSFTYQYTNKISQAIQTQRKIQSIVSSEKHSFSQAYSQLNLARLYMEIGNYEVAERYYNQLLDFFLENESLYDVALINLALGKIQLRLGSFAASKVSLEKGLSLFTSQYSAERLRTKIELANYYLAVNELGMAKTIINEIKEESSEQLLDIDKIQFSLTEGKLYELEEKIDLHSKLLNSILENHDFDTINISQKIDFLEQKITNLVNLNLTSEIDSLFEDTLKIIQKIRQELYVIYAGEIWVNHTNKLTRQYISFLYDRYKKEKNYRWLEMLFDILESNYSINTVQQRKLIKAKSEGVELPITQFKAYLETEKELLQAVNESQREKAARKRDLSLEVLKATERIDYRNQAFNFESLSLEKIKRFLRTNETIIRYFFVDHKLKAFVISSDGWFIQEYGQNFEFEELTKKILKLEPYKLLENSVSLRNFDGLIPKSITDKENLQKLIIVPTEMLEGVPFTAFHGGEKNSKYRPIAETAEVIRVNNLSSYFVDDKSQFPNNYPHITIFADPQFTPSMSADVINAGDLQRSWLDNLTRLPATLQEARAISSIFSSLKVNTYLGIEATTKNLMSVKSRSSSILHIASHGFFSESTPDLVGIATTKDKHDTNSFNIGFLSLRELVSKPFLSKLVIVSGCETGLGKVMLGGSMASLSNGLIGQGAGSVISTLWKIPDKSTALFFQHFYHVFKNNGGNSVNALNEARLKFIRSGRYKHPKYWAGFVLTVANHQYETINLN